MGPQDPSSASLRASLLQAFESPAGGPEWSFLVSLSQRLCSSAGPQLMQPRVVGGPMTAPPQTGWRGSHSQGPARLERRGS